MSNFQNQKQRTGSGLTRYRSAPSSYFSNLLSTNNSSGGFGAEDYEQLFNPRDSSPDETQRIYSMFVGNSEPIQENEYAQSQSQSNSQFLPPRNSEAVIQHPLQRQQSNDHSSVYHIMYQDIVSGTPNNSYTSLLGSNLASQVKMESGSGNSGLIRQSSSPAGLFANINIEKDFGAMRGMGDFGGGNTSNVEGSFSSTSRFNNSRQIDFSLSRRSSTTRMMMAPISEIENVHIKENNSGDVEFDEGDSIPGFPINAWDDSAIFSDNFLNELAENENKVFSSANASDDQSNEGGNRSRTRLAHHLSMPTSSAELSALEKLLEDSVPCKIRAKRGFATHPRSIAERVRRTKISERMRKLQELVPNMEKQTNTSDMLDLAVDYIKDLQKQVTKLSDAKEKCSCLVKEKL